MKYLKLKFLLMFFALAMAIPPAWAETVSTTILSTTQDGSTLTWSNNSLTFSLTQKPSSVQYSVETASPARGLGTGSKTGTHVLTSDQSFEGVTSVEVIASTNSNSGYSNTISVSVGNTAIGSAQTILSGTANANKTYTYQSTNPCSGKIVITINDENKSVWIKSITVTYQEGGNEPTENLYKKVTSADQIVAGKKYILVAGNYAMGAVVNQSTAPGVEVTIENNTIDIAGTEVAEYVLSEEHFSYGNSWGYNLILNGQSIGYAGSGKFGMVETPSLRQYYWTFISSSNGYTVRNSDSDYIAYSIRMLTSSHVFAPYKQADSNTIAYLYVQEGSEQPVTPPSLSVDPSQLTLKEGGGLFNVTGTNLVDNVGITQDPEGLFNLTFTGTGAQNWGFERNSDNKVNGTVKVEYKGRELTVTGSIIPGTDPYENAPDEEPDIEAPVTVTYQPDVYLYGDFGSGSWGYPEDAQFDYANNVYSKTVSCDNTFFIMFARKAGESYDWKDNRYFFSAKKTNYWTDEQGNSVNNWVYTKDECNELELSTSGGQYHCIQLPAGEYKITINAAEKTFSILSTTVNNLTEANKYPTGETFTFNGRVVVTHRQGKNLWVRDVQNRDGSTTAGYIYSASNGANFEPGDVIKAGWTGKRTVHHGLDEFQDVSGLVKDGETDYDPEELNAINPVTDINKYVVFKGVDKIVDTEGNVVDQYNQFNYTFTPEEGKIYDVYAIVSYYDKLQYYPISAENVTPPELTITLESETKTALVGESIPVTVKIENAVGEYTANYKIGDANPVSCQNGDVINVTSATAGTVTVTATVTNNGLEKSVTETYSFDEPLATEFVLVTDISQLEAGKQIVIADNTTESALSNNQKSNNRGVANITISDNMITATDATEIMTLEKDGDYWYLRARKYAGYLYAAGGTGDNWLRTKADKDNSAQATISITDDGATVAFNIDGGTNARNIIKYNTTSDLFACYKASYTDKVRLPYIYVEKPAVEQVATPEFSPEPQEEAFTTTQSVTITCATDGAKIYYNINSEEDPTAESTPYEEAITVGDGTTTIKAIAIADGMTDSEVVTKTYVVNLPSLEAPVITPESGEKNNAVEVTITPANGAKAYYKLNDAEEWAEYTEPFTVDGNTQKVTAIAKQDNHKDSPEATATYTFAIAPLTFTPAAGTFNAAQTVEIATETQGAKIEYSTDGGTTWNDYPAEGIPVGENTTIQARATKDGYTAPEETASAAYVIDLPVTVAPQFDHMAGTYTGAQTVAITAPAGKIYYEIDGAKSFAEYTAPIEVGVGTTTINAYAQEDGKAPSATVSATYIIEAAPAELTEITPFDGYYKIKNLGNSKYANVQGRRTLTFTNDIDEQAGTVIRLKTDNHGQVQVLRSQAADLQGYADKAMGYVPGLVHLVAEKLEVEGVGALFGESGVDAIIDKFKKGFDAHLYVEQYGDGWRIYGKTPSMQHVVDFYRENQDKVDAKLPMLETAINNAIDKILEKTNGSGASILTPFSLHTIWEKMDNANIPEPVVDNEDAIMDFYRTVLNNKNYVWDFAYETAMIYWTNLKEHPEYDELIKPQLGEFAEYIEMLPQVHPDFKYYIAQENDKPDFISQGNVDVDNARNIWSVEPRTDFYVDVPAENQVGDEYVTTLYTDFAYTMSEDDATAYKVTGVDEAGVAQLEAIGQDVPAQTPVLIMADNAGDVELTLNLNDGTPIESELKGPDYLIREYQLKNPTVEKMFNLVKTLFGDEIYNRYMLDYEHLMLRYAGLQNNKYFWGLPYDEVKTCVYINEYNEGECVVRSLDIENGVVAFYDNKTVDTNKAFLVTETLEKILLELPEVAAPTFLPEPGSYTEALTVEISCETDGAELYYSTDGGTTWTQGNSVPVSKDMTLMAKAVKDGVETIANGVYSFEFPVDPIDITPFDGYFKIRNLGNDKYANVQGRRTLTFTNDIDKQAGTVIRLKTDEHGQVQVLRSQAADLQGYADKAMGYVPELVHLVAEKLEVEGVGALFGESGVDAIIDKFNEGFDHHLYVEPFGDGWRIYGKTPSMQHVVEFYRENQDKVDAKLPMLETAINNAIDKILDKTNGSGASILEHFSLHTIWEKMNDPNLIEPVEGDDDAILAFYHQVLMNKDYVWKFAYETAMIYWTNLKEHPKYDTMIKPQLGEFAEYIEMLPQVRPNFKYYIAQENDKPDYISQGNVDVDKARNIWSVEKRTTFKVNIPDNATACNKVKAQKVTTLYTDFAYTMSEDDATAYKVTGVDEAGVAQLEAIGQDVPAQTPVLIMADNAGDVELTLNLNDGTPIESELKGPDYLIREYQLKNPTVEKMFNLVKTLFGDEIYNRYMLDYEHLMLRYAGLQNNKYFWGLPYDEVKTCVYINEYNEGECVVRSLDVQNGKAAFYDNKTVETNKAFLVTDKYDTIYLSLRGDVNHDGKVNLLDVTDLIDRLLVIPDAEHLKACPYCSDVNENNLVNIKDLTVLIDILLGNDSTEP